MDVQNEEGHESRCVFRNILHKCRRRNDSEFREPNVENFNEASRKIKDKFYDGLSKDTSTLIAHEKHNLEYKSSDHIRHHLKRFANEGPWSVGAIKCTRWSFSAINFDFKSDCIFCGIACDDKTNDADLIGS